MRGRYKKEYDIYHKIRSENREKQDEAMKELFLDDKIRKMATRHLPEESDGLHRSQLLFNVLEKFREKANTGVFEYREGKMYGYINKLLSTYKLDQYKKERRQKAKNQAYQDEQSSRVGAGEVSNEVIRQLGQMEFWHLLEPILRTLGKWCYEFIAFDYLSTRELAEITGYTSLDAVKSEKSTCWSKFRKKLRDEPGLRRTLQHLFPNI